MKKLVTVNSRGQVSLGRLAENTYYMAELLPDGRIVLEPFEVVSILEQAKKRGPDA